MGTLSLFTNLKRYLRSDPDYIHNLGSSYEIDDVCIRIKKIRLDDSIVNSGNSNLTFSYDSFQMVGELKIIWDIAEEEFNVYKSRSQEYLTEVFLLTFKWPFGRIFEDQINSFDLFEPENSNNSIFNLPLSLISDDLKCQKCSLPRVIVELMKSLSGADCLETIGAFRIDALVAKTSQNEVSICSGIESVGFCLKNLPTFAKMSLLKSFFRRIPGNLVNRSIVILMYRISSVYDEAPFFKDLIRWLLTCIPFENYKALGLLCALLNRYAREEGSNLMTAGSLAICWSPIIFDLDADILLYKKITKIMTLFITNWDKFFILPF